MKNYLQLAFAKLYINLSDLKLTYDLVDKNHTHISFYTSRKSDGKLYIAFENLGQISIYQTKFEKFNTFRVGEL